MTTPDKQELAGTCPVCRSRLAAARIHLDARRETVTWPGGEAKLTMLETRVMEALARAAGNVVRLERLVHAAWGLAADGGPDNAPRALYVHVCHLRRRLAKAGFPGRIVNRWGIGYELELA
jgi:DNA-binding response OmpR family regulator